MKSMQSESKNNILKITKIIAFILWAAIIIFVLIHRRDITISKILNYTPDNPLLAAIAIQGMFALKSMTFVFYSGFFYIINGLLFPLPLAILLNMLGTMVMVLIPYNLGHLMGSKYAEELTSKYSALKAIENARNSNEIAFIILMRCVKVVNFDLGSMYMGSVNMRLPLVLLGSVAGMLPDIVLFPIIGANLDNPGSPAFWLALGLDAAIAVITVVISKKYTKKESRNDSF